MGGVSALRSGQRWEDLLQRAQGLLRVDRGGDAGGGGGGGHRGP